MATTPSNARADLHGQVALVTGGGRGLGRGFAGALAAAGAALAVAAHSAAEIAETVSLVRDAGGRACASKLDVGDVTDVDGCVAAVEHELGPIDLLVNNAGVASPPGMDWEVDSSAWWRTLEINLRGPFLCARDVLPGMIARQRGRIINISSAAAFGNSPSLSAYGVSKAALTHWSGRLAAQVEQDGVAVIAYAPSVVRTAMTEPPGDLARLDPNHPRRFPAYIRGGPRRLPRAYRGGLHGPRLRSRRRPDRATCVGE